MQYHIHDIIQMILPMTYYDIKELYYDTIKIYDIIVAQGSRCTHSSIWNPSKHLDKIRVRRNRTYRYIQGRTGTYQS